MLKIYGVKKSTPLNRKIFSYLISKISVKKRNRINRFMRNEDACRVLMADILARVIICKTIKIKNREIEFRENEYGKPSLLNFDDIHFNISYSYDWIVCAIDQKSLGIDIEKIKPIDFDIATSFFSKIECLELFGKNKKDKLNTFFELWTLKESYIKAIGKGLSKSLNSFIIKMDEQTPIIEDYEDIKAHLRYFLKQYNIDHKYKLAVCSQHQEFPEIINILSFEKIYNDFLLYSQ